MALSQSIQKQRKEKTHNLEIKIKVPERKLNNVENKKLYNGQKLDKIFDDIIEGI